MNKKFYYLFIHITQWLLPGLFLILKWGGVGLVVVVGARIVRVGKNVIFKYLPGICSAHEGDQSTTNVLTSTNSKNAMEYKCH
jgi:hypothetical protein